ncbi:enoyl-CoA hydratase/isomerase family protein [Variovorax sp. J2P1-59]|uniref:enoyl-CoA hydratase/isomerase family protein n=1 Tax=Variovorax flavidus TaxID=3053501 RepID=UPI002577E827|nr:enoyl-CoA hydratase/isomerase family protein [Variovorax sp. J2P1-59]MDM0073456.1 enoyl-CoA hydratase/isomerase family protein [Variovorax sp. J2P1-59]
MSDIQDLRIVHDGAVALVEMDRPPHNFVDADFMQRLADALERLDQVDTCRAVVLMSAGKNFCAGADFSGAVRSEDSVNPSAFYVHAMRLFGTSKPIVAAVNGAAVGAGLGLTLAADFRVAGPGTRFSANFNRLGFHPGFGLTLTLPRLIGEQKASLLFYTGRRIGGEEAARIGLADEVAADDAEIRTRAIALAQEIAASAPLAVESTRAALRADLQKRVAQANQHELSVQLGQFRTEDFKEGVAAMAERRLPVFHRR